MRKITFYGLVYTVTVAIIVTFCQTTIDITFAMEKELSKMDHKYSIEFTIDTNRHFTLYESMVVNALIKNTGDDTLTILHPVLGADLKVYIGSSLEQVEILKQYEFIYPVRSTKQIQIGTNQEYRFSFSIDPNVYILPNKSGKYVMKAVYTGFTKYDNSKKLWTGSVESNTVNFLYK